MVSNKIILLVLALGLAAVLKRTLPKSLTQKITPWMWAVGTVFMFYRAILFVSIGQSEGATIRFILAIGAAGITYHSFASSAADADHDV